MLITQFELSTWLQLGLIDNIFFQFISQDTNNFNLTVLLNNYTKKLTEFIKSYKLIYL